MLLWLHTGKTTRPKGTARQRKATLRKRMQRRRKGIRVAIGAANLEGTWQFVFGAAPDKEET
jgi:hypothetical protein